MLASPGPGRAGQPRIPGGEGWLHEVKWDGMRVLADVREGRVTLRSRTGRDVSVSFPEIAGASGFDGLASALDDALVDGEVVAMGPDGVPHFSALGERMHVSIAAKAAAAARRRPVVLLAFDLLRLDGRELVGVPLRERRALLEEALAPTASWQVPPAYADGPVLWAATREQGLEGIVSKQADSPYRPGVRSEAWLKFPHRESVSVVVGGWRTETDKDRLGSLLVGEMTAGGLRYLGRIGSGLAGAAGRVVEKALAGLDAEASPFSEEMPVPAADARGTTWVRPEMVVELHSLGLTGQGRLRQPSFQGIRTDLTPADLLELVEPVTTPDDDPDDLDARAPAGPGASAIAVGDRQIRVSSLDKVLYPASGTTKAEVLSYYAAVADLLLPVVEGRPVTRIRWPNGVGGQSFFEKNRPSGAPDWMRLVTLYAPGSNKGRETIDYPLVDDLAALLHLANLGSLELHVPQWRVDPATLDEPVSGALSPDRLVIDLDPGPPAGLHECAQVALLVREALAGAPFAGLDAGRLVPVTSGSKGLQLYAALDGSLSSDEVRDRAKKVAEALTRAHPGLVVAKMTKDLRPGKVLLDWSQNTAAKTTIAPYSLRGREVVAAAWPRTWGEIETGAENGDALAQVGLAEALERAGTDEPFTERLG